MGAIALQSVEKWFGEVQVIKGIDLEIGSEEFVVFVGPSGCGKSTLLRLIAGLEEISRGSLQIGGERRDGAASREARPRDGVPVLRALPAYDRSGEHGVQPEERRPSERRDRKQGGGSRQDSKA